MNKQLQLHGLYVITNESLMPAARFNAMAEASLSAGARIIQYRDKSRDTQKRLQQSQALRQLCDQYDALLIINDDAQLAIDCAADGIHIGKDDATLAAVRSRVGEDMIIGVSCYNDSKLAEQAIQQGADYIAFGSFFGSQIKPDAPRANVSLISHIKQHYSTPVCCIGGIKQDNCLDLLTAGADMLAVISEVFAEPDIDRIQAKCESLISVLKTHATPLR